MKVKDDIWLSNPADLCDRLNLLLSQFTRASIRYDRDKAIGMPGLIRAVLNDLQLWKSRI